MIFGKYDERSHAAAAPERHDRPIRKTEPQPIAGTPTLPIEKSTIES
jgi:hypothetical protein